MKTTSTQKPETILQLGNGVYYYNYDIKERFIELEDGSKQTIWEFMQARINGVPNYKDCVKQMIRLFVTLEEEFDLINSANRVALGLSVDDSNKTKYVNYLNLVESIKEDALKYFNR